MKRLVVTAATAAGIGLLCWCSSVQAALINFTVTAIDGTPTYSGSSLDQSTAVDFDTALLLVSEVGPGDASGLTPGADTVTLNPMEIVYGAGDGPGALPGDGVTKMWTSDDGDVFTETLTVVDLIDRTITNQVVVHLSGMVNDSNGDFVNVPAFLVLNATQFGGVGTATTLTFTNTAGGIMPGVPETSTWMMMAVGFGALGYAAFRRRASNLSLSGASA
jgi:hypothetical protein